MRRTISPVSAVWCGKRDISNLTGRYLRYSTDTECGTYFTVAQMRKKNLIICITLII